MECEVTMAIRIRVDVVDELSGSFKNNLSKIAKVQSGMSALKYSVDSSISARRNIDSRMSSAVQSLNSLEVRLRTLESFIHQSMGKYGDAENAILHDAQMIGENRSGHVVDLSNRGGYGSYSDSFVFGVPLFSKLLKENWLQTMKNAWNLSFVTYKQNGITYIQVLNGQEKTSDLMKEKLGQSVNKGAKWSKGLADKLVNEGIGLGQWEEDGFRYFKKSHLFTDSHIPGMSQYMDQLGESRWKVLKDGFGSDFQKGLNISDDFKGWKGVSTMAKLGKAAGIFGNIITVVDVANDTFIDQQTGEFKREEGDVVKFTVDSAISVGSSTAAMATGAAIGSLIVPPLGTVVGIGAGLAINWAINADCFKGKSLVDWTEVGANKLIDYAVDGIDQGAQKLKDVSRQAAEALGDAAKDVENVIRSVTADAVDQVDDVINDIGKRLAFLF